MTISGFVFSGTGCIYMVSIVSVGMGWLRLVGSLKLFVSFAEYCLFYRALLKKRHNSNEPTNRSHPVQGSGIYMVSTVSVNTGLFCRVSFSFAE